MTRIALALLALGVLGMAAAAVRQHLRYLKIRRTRVEDRQPLLYGGAAFHAVIFLKVAADRGRDGELSVLRALRDAIESPGGGQVVYAGLAGMTMVASSQVPSDWSAVALAWYPSREAYDRNRESAEMQRVLDACQDSYVHGFVRPALANLMIPVGLGALRLRDIVLRKEPILPFEPVADAEALPKVEAKRKEALRLDSYRDVRDDAVVIINLLQPGTADQRAADRAYAFEMIRGMAEGAYGPMHMGRAITVEGDSRFDRFAAVYYPGIDHMHAMLGSRFMSRIAPGKQLADTLAVATIPVLSKL